MALKDVLGIEEAQSRSYEYPGEFTTMVFADDRPPGFPERVWRESANARLVTATNARGRVIADWHDRSGEDLGCGAVVITDDTVWTSHVFWRNADADLREGASALSVG